MWNYTCCCCTVALWWLWKNVEVSNGLLKLKRQDRSCAIVDTVWKELSCAVRSEESQSVDADEWAFWKHLEESRKILLSIPWTRLSCSFRGDSEGSHMIFYLWTSNTLSHNIIPKKPHAWNGFFLCSSEGKSRISFAVEKHMTSLQTDYSRICGSLISENVFWRY